MTGERAPGPLAPAIPISAIVGGVIHCLECRLEVGATYRVMQLNDNRIRHMVHMPIDWGDGHGVRCGFLADQSMHRADEILVLSDSEEDNTNANEKETGGPGPASGAGDRDP